MALLHRPYQTPYQPTESIETRDPVQEDVVERQHSANVAERIVWFVAGVLLVLLGLRFLFALLGANTGNGLVSFDYVVAYPFVAPFFNLFNYNFTEGLSHFEGYTLIAIAIYALIAWGIAHLVTIRRP